MSKETEVLPIGHSDRHDDEKAWLRGMIHYFNQRLGNITYESNFQRKRSGIKHAIKKVPHFESMLKKCDDRLTYLLELKKVK